MIAIKQIKAKYLRIDPRVQRDKRSEPKLNRMRRDFQEDALGVLSVSQRDDGTYVVFDGWHRLTVVMELLKGDYSLTCEVFTGLTVEQEAGLFLWKNNQEPASRIDKHNIAVLAEDPRAVEIDKAVKANDWVVGTGKGKISAIAALETAYDRGEEWIESNGHVLLYNTLMVVTGAWGHEDPYAVCQQVIKGVSEFLLLLDREWADPATGREIDYEHLIGKLAGLKKGPKGWIDACRGVADGTNKKRLKAMLESLHERYQEGKRGRHRLPDLGDLTR